MNHTPFFSSQKHFLVDANFMKGVCRSLSMVPPSATANTFCTISQYVSKKVRFLQTKTKTFLHGFMTIQEKQVQLRVIKTEKYI